MPTRESARELLPIWLVVQLALVLILSGCATPDKEKGASEEQETADDPEEVTPPQWYTEREYPSRDSLVLIGYGSGEARGQARMRALDEIASQLGVTIDVEQEDIAKVEIEDQQQKIEEEYRQETRMEATHHIKDWEVVQAEHIQGKHFVMFRLDRRPSPIVIAEKIADRLERAPEMIHWEGIEALTQGPFVESIERHIAGDDGTPASIALDLERIAEQWHIAVEPNGKDVFHVPLDEPDIKDLLTWPQQGEPQHIQLTLDPDLDRGYNRLRVGDWFVFELTSEQSGYISLFNIYQDGRVSVLEDNARIDSRISIPSKEEQEQGHAFRAHPIQRGELTQDYYLAVLTDQELSTADFQKILDQSPPVEGEEAYQLHQLIEWVEDQHSHVVDIDVIEVLTQP